MSLVLGLFVAVGFVVWSTTRGRLHPFLALLLASYGFGLASGQRTEEVVEVVASGFGRTLGHVGIVILAGAIIGVFLERSGGAKALAVSTLKRIGPNRVPLAMAVIGYVVSMPVFCDSAFVLLAPLMSELSRRSRTSLAAAASALSLGLLVTHTLVPPTPGPVAAAGILGAQLGWVVGVGAGVSLGALAAGWFFASRVGPRFPLEGVPIDAAAPRDVEGANGPSVGRALAPILVPIILLLAGTTVQTGSSSGVLHEVLSFVGAPTIALLVGVGLSFRLPARFGRDLWSPGGWVGQAIVAAATILVVTGAGGAFGAVLSASPLGSTLEGWLAPLRLGVTGPFVLAATLKTAQGSSTVAMITTASMVAPVLGSLGLESEMGRVLAVVAIGAGSMVVSHANDSYFWVVTQFTGMDVRVGYRLHTVGTLVVGSAAFLILWGLSFAII